MTEATSEYRRFSTARLREREKELRQMRRGSKREIDAEIEMVRAEIERRERCPR